MEANTWWKRWYVTAVLLKQRWLSLLSGGMDADDWQSVVCGGFQSRVLVLSSLHWVRNGGMESKQTGRYRRSRPSNTDRCDAVCHFLNTVEGKETDTRNRWPTRNHEHALTHTCTCTCTCVGGMGCVCTGGITKSNVCSHTLSHPPLISPGQPLFLFYRARWPPASVRCLPPPHLTWPTTLFLL